MFGCLPCIIVLVFIAGVVALGIAAHRANQARTRQLQALATELGFTFDPSHHTDWHRRWERFECFQRGHGRSAFNLMSGSLPGSERNDRCIVGEYTFKETHGSGNDTRTVTYRFGFIIVVTPWRGMPDMLVRREHLFDKVAGFLGFDDIDFESAEFSRTFMVKSTDKRFAYDLIDPRMMEFLMASPAPLIDIGDDACCLWRGQDATLEPEGFRALIDWASQFMTRWPRVVVARFDPSSPNGAT